MTSVTIATPMYGGQCSGAFTKSLINTIPALLEAGISVSFIDIYNESLITRARDLLTHIFLANKTDYLLFIDADQTFRPEDVIAMIKSDKDIIGAPVPMKGINWSRVKQAAKADKQNLEEYSGIFNVNFLPDFLKTTKEIKLSDPVEVLYVGTGMLLIKRSVFEKMEDLVSTYTHDGANIPDSNIITGQTKIKNFWNTTVVDGRLLSEDYNFCNMWKSTGGKIYVYLLAKVSHIGNYIFSGVIFDQDSINRK
jgi:hypothetical protein